jgi:hypothetical protein
MLIVLFNQPFNPYRRKPMEQYTDPQKKPKFSEQMRTDIRQKHYRRATERTYWYWLRQYIYYHQKQHPNGLNNTYIEQSLNYLAVEKRSAETTQAR